MISLRWLRECGAVAVLAAVAAGTDSRAVWAEEVCAPASDRGVVGCIRLACDRLFQRQPYRPFDDHFPRFHPVPTNPVFPSLAEPASGNQSASKAERGPRELNPRIHPQPGMPPKPVPELVPTPPGRSGGSVTPQRAPIPRNASRPAGNTTTWIFLPAAVPEATEESLAKRSPAVASESSALLR